MRDPIEQLGRIQNALMKIAEYTNKGRRKFDEEEETRISMIYYLQTISEAARAIPQDYRQRHPEIPWKQLIDFQNFITYYYREIDRDATWTIVSIDLPGLKTKVDALLEASIRQDVKNKNAYTSVHGEAARAFRELLQAKREDILRTATAHGVSNVRVFGSVVRGEADAESDIDLLVDVEPGRTLFDLSELLADLQNLLGHDIDIVTEKGLNRRMRERVLKEAVPL